jgi:hypothetical protein
VRGNHRIEWGWIAFCALYIAGGTLMLWVIVTALEQTP